MELLIKNLSKTYLNGVHALKGVNLSIKPGMFGLLGPNGAGKSSLMRTLATLQEADEGEIFLGTINILKQKEAVRKILGYLPQEFGFYPNTPAESMLDHFASLKGVHITAERKVVVQNLLNQTNLWAHRKKRLGTFSGGMRQRFGIAVAMIGNPQLIIVDEPTAGLDPVERNRFLDLLSEIGENIIVILSTHIVDDVAELCSSMAILSEGRILAEGPPQDLIHHLKGKIYKALLPKEELISLRTSNKVISSKLVAGKPLVRIFSETGLNPPGFESAEPTLEDVYFLNVGGQASLAGKEENLNV